MAVVEQPKKGDQSQKVYKCFPTPPFRFPILHETKPSASVLIFISHKSFSPLTIISGFGLPNQVLLDGELFLLIYESEFWWLG